MLMASKTKQPYTLTMGPIAPDGRVEGPARQFLLYSKPVGILVIRKSSGMYLPLSSGRSYRRRSPRLMNHRKLYYEVFYPCKGNHNNRKLRLDYQK